MTTLHRYAKLVAVVILISLVAVSCHTNTPTPLFQAPTISSVTVTESTITVKGEHLYQLSSSSGFVGNLTIDVCGLTLTDIRVEGTPQSVVLAPGKHAVIVRADTVSAAFTPGATDESNTITITNPDGQEFTKSFDCSLLLPVTEVDETFDDDSESEGDDTEGNDSDRDSTDTSDEGTGTDDNDTETGNDGDSQGDGNEDTGTSNDEELEGLTIALNFADTMDLSFEVPIIGDGELVIHWGDGNTTEVPDATTGEHLHVYEEPGEYTVVIVGELVDASFGFGEATYPGAEHITAVTDWGPSTFVSFSGAFNGAGSLTSVPDLQASVTDISYMFSSAQAFNDDIRHWDVTHIANMEGLFFGAASFKRDLSYWCVSNIPEKPDFFDSDSGFEGETAKQPYWGYECDAEGPLTIHITIENPNTDFELPLTGTGTAFINWDDGSRSLLDFPTHIYVEPGDYTITVVGFLEDATLGNGDELYDGAETIIALANWGDDITYTSLAGAFNGATNLSSVPGELPNDVADLSYTFAGAESFNGDLSDWETGAVTNMSHMFLDATAFTGLGLESWNTSSVTSMEGMFQGAKAFNGEINTQSTTPPKWDTSNVTNMQNMFHGATVFNQDIGGWNTSDVTDMSFMFLDATAFTGLGLDNWNTSSVTTMEGMFRGAEVFNGEINTQNTTPPKWDISKVTNMRHMFHEATTFNQPIGNWDITKVAKTDMEGIFFGATTFNQDLTTWCASHISAKPSVFDDNSDFEGQTGKQPYWGYDCNEAELLTIHITTANPDAVFELPLTGSGTALINWGDGFTSPSISPSHIYAIPNEYTITVIGTLTEASLGNEDQSYNGAETITELESWGDNITYTSLSGAFNGATNLTDVPDTIPTGITNLSYTFTNAKAFEGDISNWDTSAVTTMESMFQGAELFDGAINTKIDALPSWDTTNVTNMKNMFNGATKFNQPLYYWNTFNVTTMEGMFKDAISFNQDIETQLVNMIGASYHSWSTHNVTTMESMFQGATKFNGTFSRDGWNTAKVETMESMFQGATEFEGAGIDQWITSSVTNMKSMFQDTIKFNGYFDSHSSWNTAAVETMESMFQDAKAFEGWELGHWDTSKVTTMKNMFNGAEAFHGEKGASMYDLGDWVTSSVINMQGMFAGATSFNQDISDWNTSNVTTMESMFNGATNFDQNLTTWCVSQITARPNSFDNDSAFGDQTGKQPYWGTKCDTEPLVLQIEIAPDSPKQFYLPLTGNGTITIHWDDNHATTTKNPTTATTHTYSNTGIYTIKVYGSLNNATLGSGSSTYRGAETITKLENWGNSITYTSLSGAFNGATNLTDVPDTLPPGVSNLSYTFAGAVKFNSDISNWNTSNVTTMESMFQGAALFVGERLGDWGENTSSVTNMKSMFQNALSFRGTYGNNSNINNWDVSSATTMESMFEGIHYFYGNLTSWEVGKVTNCIRFNEGALGGWDDSRKPEFPQGCETPID